MYILFVISHNVELTYFIHAGIIKGSENKTTDGKPFTTLGYVNGDGYIMNNKRIVNVLHLRTA